MDNPATRVINLEVNEDAMPLILSAIDCAVRQGGLSAAQDLLPLATDLSKQAQDQSKDGKEGKHNG